MNRRRLFHEMISIIGVALVNAAACAGPEGAPPGIENLTQQLTSEDPKVAEEARTKLEGMGAEVVPALFEKLPAADWTLKPRLLEVLSRNGREFAKQKLLKGNESEKVYAALVYELTRLGKDADYGTPEFKAMVDALLQAIRSKDKYLRAAAGLAFVYDMNSAVFFDHFPEIIPALLSSFDTDLVIARPVREDPSDVVLVGICLRLDALIGDRLAYNQIERKLWTGVKDFGTEPNAAQRSMAKLLPSWSVELEALRGYWQSWWDEHNNAPMLEIARLIIERDISLLEASNGKLEYHTSIASSYLQLWTGEYFTNAREARLWWTAQKDAYRGPKNREP